VPVASGDAARIDAAEVNRMLAAVAVERARCASGKCARACESGDGKACGLAAERLRDGKHGHAFDPATAWRYATRGCALGDGLACAVLGEQNEDGIGAAWAPEAAITAYDNACRAGSGLGCLGLAAMYARGHGVDADPRKAATYFESARSALQAGCNGADPRSCLYAARAFYNDEDTRTRPERRLLLKRACERGVAGGCVDALIDRLRPGGPGVTAALGTLDQLCTRGAPGACSILAWHLEHETRPGRNDDGARAAALALMIRGCEIGDRDGCVAAGQRYDRGRGVARDDEAKRSYFGRACDRGAGLGCLYLARDAALAPGREDRVAGFAQRACELGEAEGCAMLVRSQVVQRADAAADRWAIEGCRLRSRYSCERLVERDLELPPVPAGWSRQLFQLACGRGLPPACRRLAKLEQAEEPVLRGVKEAVAKQDVAAFARLASSSVDLYQLWFDDPACEKFSGQVLLTAGAHRAFLACLSSHDLRLDPQASADRSPALVYHSGAVLTVDLVDGAIVRIAGPPANDSLEPNAVTPTALETHRIAGKKLIVPDDQTKDEIYRAHKRRLVGSFKLCITTEGQVASAVMLKSTGFSSYDQKIMRELYTWRYRPFLIDGRPESVCTAVTFIYSQR
jgi:TPR repeat protein